MKPDNLPKVKLVVEPVPKRLQTQEMGNEVVEMWRREEFVPSESASGVTAYFQISRTSEVLHF